MPSRGGGDDSGGVASRPVRHRHSPGLLDLGARNIVGDRPAAGQQCRYRAGLQGAPLTGAPRNPGQPGAGVRGQPGRRGVEPGHLGGPLPHQQHRVRLTQRLAHRRLLGAQRLQKRCLTAGQHPQQRAEGAAHRRRGELTEVPHRQLAVAGGAAQPQVDDRRLLLGLEGHAQHRRGRRQVVVGHRTVIRGHADDVRSEEVQLLSGVRPGAEVDVVGAQRDPGELGVGEGVLHRQPATGQDPYARVARGQQSLGRCLQRLSPRRRP